MVSLNASRLIVIDSEGKIISIVTRTDILKRIAGLIELWLFIFIVNISLQNILIK